MRRTWLALALVVSACAATPATPDASSPGSSAAVPAALPTAAASSPAPAPPAPSTSAEPVAAAPSVGTAGAFLTAAVHDHGNGTWTVTLRAVRPDGTVEGERRAVVQAPDGWYPLGGDAATPGGRLAFSVTREAPRRDGPRVVDGVAVLDLSVAVPVLAVHPGEERATWTADGDLVTLEARGPSAIVHWRTPGTSSHAEVAETAAWRLDWGPAWAVALSEDGAVFATSPDQLPLLVDRTGAVTDRRPEAAPWAVTGLERTRGAGGTQMVCEESHAGSSCEVLWIEPDGRRSSTGLSTSESVGSWHRAWLPDGTGAIAVGGRRVVLIRRDGDEIVVRDLARLPPVEGEFATRWPIAIGPGHVVVVDDWDGRAWIVPLDGSGEPARFGKDSIVGVVSGP